MERDASIKVTKPPNTRRVHEKSKTGCAECKRRKIKCDETRPICSGCTRRSTHCLYPILKPRKPPHSAASSTSPAILAAYPTRMPENGDVFTLEDMNLFHHFIITTCSTLAPKANMIDTWRTVVPRLAVAHPFLMHGLLAISALHLAYLQPYERAKYCLLAAQHQDIAIGPFRKAMGNINAENCNAMFTFSSIIVAYGLASAQNPMDLLLSNTGDGSVAEWLLLLRGTSSIILTAWAYLEAGPMAPALEQVDKPPMNTENPNDHRLGDLSRLFALPSFLESNSTEDMEAYQTALRDLRKAFSICSRKDLNISLSSAVFTWPAMLAPRILNCLGQRREPALILFAYWCILFKKLDMYWYMKNRASELFSAIHQTLGPDWKEFVEWPRQEIQRMDCVFQEGLT